MDILIIFDVDGTLIGSHGWDMWGRPHLKSLFKFCFENFRVGVWSAAKSLWISMVYSNIFESIIKEINAENDTDYAFVFMFDRSCTTMNPDTHVATKQLSILWEISEFKKCNTLIVDDRPETFQDNIENGVLMPSIESMSKKDCSKDEWLFYFVEFLKIVLVHYAQEHTIETIKKDSWWDRLLTEEYNIKRS